MTTAGPAEDSVTGTRAAVGVEDLSKSYGANKALDGVSLTVRSGTIHALLGGNGSGKSTLIKILAGVVPADGGTIVAGGHAVDATSQTPATAAAMGLRFVHQQSSTFPDLTVAENLAIGHGFETGRGGRVNWSRQRARAAEVLDRFGIPASPDDRMSGLGAAMQMMVAIARALQDQDGAHDGVLVLDEPTASLPRHEVEMLLDALVRYARAGQAIVLVTHRLPEVLQVADHATVLRDGRLSGHFTRDEFDHDTLVSAIMGRSLARATARAVEAAAPTPGQTVLELRVAGEPEAELVLRAGECVGVAGLLGSGRSSLLRRIFGASPRPDEELLVDGRPVPGGDPPAAISAGLAYIPEDRPSDAMFPDQSLTRNMSISALRHHLRGVLVDARSERRRARDLVRTFAVRTASEELAIGALSGGNQQKVIVARWMQREPRVLLLDEPTQGVDVGARAEIHALIRQATEAGAAALVVSSEFEELVAVSDRAVVVTHSRVTRHVPHDQLDEDTLNTLVYAQEKLS